MLDHLRIILPWHSIAEWTREWYALIFLAVVILIVFPRSPLVDHIRARDESAKDANRLLAQLFGRLSNVEHCAYWYLEEVDAIRIKIIKMAVLKATNGLYTWTHTDGLKPRANGYLETAPEPLPNEKAEKLDQACRELADHLAEYRRNGLHTVAYRMARPVSCSLDACRIRFDDAEANAYMSPRLLLGLCDRDFSLAGNGPEEIFEAERRGDDECCEQLRIQIDNAARNFACHLDSDLASAYATLRHLKRINYYLNKRLHGNPRTRLASSLIR